MRLDIDLRVHLPGDAEVKDLLGTILKSINRMEIRTMATLDDVLAKVTEQDTRLDSVRALIVELKQQVADALSGATISPAVQEKIDAVFAGLEKNTAEIDEALNTNVPAPEQPQP